MWGEEDMTQRHPLLNAILGGLTLFFAINLANAGEWFSVVASAARAAVKVQDAGMDIAPDPRGISGLGDEARIGPSRRIGY